MVWQDEVCVKCGAEDELKELEEKLKDYWKYISNLYLRLDFDSLEFNSSGFDSEEVYNGNHKYPQELAVADEFLKTIK